MKYLLVIFLVLTAEVVHYAFGAQVRTQALVDQLFTSYDITQIPACTEGENTTVSIDIALRQIIDMNEKEQLLSINVWLRLFHYDVTEYCLVGLNQYTIQGSTVTGKKRWTDCRLTWTPSLFNNISEVLVSHDKLWIPDIALYDSAADDEMYPIKDQFSGTITSDGVVIYKFPSVMKSSCDIDVTFFPFDTQRCKLQFGSWSYHSLALDLVYLNKQGDISKFVNNIEWIVEEMPAERNVLIYKCCPEPYTDVTYSIVMKRRATFYFMTMVYPCILMSLVAALVFLLPAESGEKVSLTITLLLSLAVYMLIIAELLPPASNNFPIIGIYFAIEMAIVTASCVQSVVVLNLFYHGTTGRHVPRWMKTILFEYLGKVLCFESKERRLHDENIYMEKKKHNRFEIGTNNKISPEIIDDCTPNGEVRPISQSETETLSDVHVIPAPSVSNKGPKAKPRTPQTTSSTDNNMQTEYLKRMDQYFRERSREANNNSEWRDVSNLLDRLFLVIYLFVTVLVSLILLLHAVFNRRL